MRGEKPVEMTVTTGTMPQAMPGGMDMSMPGNPLMEAQARREEEAYNKGYQAGVRDSGSYADQLVEAAGNFAGKVQFAADVLDENFLPNTAQELRAAIADFRTALSIPSVAKEPKPCPICGEGKLAELRLSVCTHCDSETAEPEQLDANSAAYKAAGGKRKARAECVPGVGNAEAMDLARWHVRCAAKQLELADLWKSEPALEAYYAKSATKHAATARLLAGEESTPSQGNPR
jgi:hypothetical protein